MKFVRFIIMLAVLASCKSRAPLANTSHEPAPAPVTTFGKVLAPLVYFQFEQNQYRTLKGGKKVVYDRDGKLHFTTGLPQKENLSPAGGCWITTSPVRPQFFQTENIFPPRIGGFTYEIAIRFDPDSMDAFQMGFDEGQVLVSPSQIVFSLVDSAGNTDRKNRLVIDNDKVPGLVAYLFDGAWHHYGFVFEGDSLAGNGMLRVFIDGKTCSAFTRKIPRDFSYTGAKFVTDFNSAKRSRKDAMDELAIWDVALPDVYLWQHSAGFFEGEHYWEEVAAEGLPDGPLPAFHLGDQKTDPEDYAPGFPNYTVNQEIQLESFPLPRFKPGVSLHRNFSWYDFMFMAYDYTLVTKNKKGEFTYPGMKQAQNGNAAIRMNTELYNHWNYYFNIPTPTYNSNDFQKPATFAGTIAAYADAHPEIQTCTYIFWAGIHPNTAGYTGRTPNIKTFGAIDPCAADTSFPLIRADGKMQRFYINRLAQAMPHRNPSRVIDFVNENGEVFGPAWTPNGEGYLGNPAIACIQQDSAHARNLRAAWQYRVFSAYRNQFIFNDSFPALKKTEFSFYQVTGIMPKYYSEWKEMRYINTPFRGIHYSTVDFYPGSKKWNLWETHGPYHGLDVIQQGRNYEIACGDIYFSPFVCGGWFSDSANFRPAEWLAALKALSMMGAEYFYPAYFNTGNPGKKIPQDPRGYIYQAAMPVYAQAVTSRYASVFFRSKNFVYNRNYNRLLIYRKDSLLPVFVILAAQFPGNNYEDIRQGEASGNVRVGNDIIKLNFREQGAVYIYDKTDPANPVFYQLDAWHEDKHPYYWSRDFAFEAEVSDDSLKHQLRTERPHDAAQNDFTRFTTYVCFTSGTEAAKPLLYSFEPRSCDTTVYYIWIKARSAAKESGIRIRCNEGKSYEVKNVQPGEFRWYCVATGAKPLAFSFEPGKVQTIAITGTDGALQIDKVLVSRSAQKPPQD
jgi:hypothetical protein